MRHDTLLILDDSQNITEALAAGLQRDDRAILTCNDVESAEVVLERLPVTYVVLDLQFSGQFGFEGLDLISYARRHSPNARIVVMTGKATSELRAEAMRRGAAGFLEKPFDVDELEALLTRRIIVQEPMLEPSSLVRMPLLDEILSSDELMPVFQPIVNLADAGRPVFGFESLTRFRGATLFSNPEILFDYAARKKRVLDLETACIGRTLEQGLTLVDRGNIFINVHPHVISTGQRFVDSLLALAERSRFSLDRLIVEITEQSSISDPVAAIQAIDALRARGARFALDDVGIAYSHLSLIDRIAPSFLKVSQHFGTQFDKDATKTKIVRNIVSLALDFGCAVILEGIECAETADAAREIGIGFGQGYFFARPAPAEDFRVAA